MTKDAARRTKGSLSRTTLHLSRSTYYALLIISLLALALRLWCLDCYGLWYDEVASIDIARRGPLAIISDRFGGMLVQTPLHYLMTWLTSLPVDPASSSLLVRLPSVIAGALTPLAVYGVGKEMFGRSQGLLAALFVAISAVHVGHSQDVRPYTLLILTVTLSVYCLLRAERGGSRRWWAAFAFSTAAALYISYFSLTLFIPALAPYLLWAVWKLWSRRGDRFRYALYSLLAVAILAIPIALDVLRIQRNPPDLTLLLREPRLLLDQAVLLITRTFQLGLGGGLEVSAQWGLLLSAALGAYAAIRARRVGALALCLSLIIIPSLLLSIARTTNPVFQRYAVFIMPFYFLLIANGVMSFRVMRERAGDGRPFKHFTTRSLQSRISPIVAAAVALPLLAGLFVYFSPEGHRGFSYPPDYRGAAQYLSNIAGPQDLIILADEPALGAEVVNFYWRGSPPAPTFDARDPRLFAQTPKGTIFLVVSFFQNNPEFLRDLPAKDAAWSDPAYLERIVILRDKRGSVTPGLERLALVSQEKLDALSIPRFQPVQTLRGVLLQARGQALEAAASYREAGAYFPQLGAEFFSSAQGFAMRGERDKAWREAITSKFMQPGNPDLHDWMAQELLTTGFPVESRIEAQIADALRR